MCEQASALRPWPAFANMVRSLPEPSALVVLEARAIARRDQGAARPTIAQIVGHDDTALVVGELNDRSPLSPSQSGRASMATTSWWRSRSAVGDIGGRRLCGATVYLNGLCRYSWDTYGASPAPVFD